MAEIVTVSAPQVGARSYVEWGAVFAGAAVALAVSLILLTFGAAIGLSSISPWTTTTTGLKAVGVARHSGCCSLRSGLQRSAAILLDACGTVGATQPPRK